MGALYTLKRGTREAHLRLERSVPIFRPGLTLAVYRAYLARLLGFYAPVEATLAGHPWASAGLDFRPRRKAALLTADLDCLGLDVDVQASLPRCDKLPPLPALPEALGCAYVLEGATLGGRVLARLVSAALGLGRARGCAFLLAYGDETDAMWEAFGARLEAALADDAAERRALSAARETFTRLHRWIDGEQGGS
jgi:heme oxygenase